MAVVTALVNVKTRTLNFKTFAGDLTLTGATDYALGGIAIPSEVLDALRSLNDIVDFVYGTLGANHRMFLDTTANTLVIVTSATPGTIAWTELADAAALPAGTWKCHFFARKNFGAEVPPIGQVDRPLP